MRSKGTRKYRQRTFLIFRQFPGLGKVDKKRLIEILRSKPAMLRESSLECGFPHAITKKRSFLPLTMSAVLTNYLHNKAFLPQKPAMRCISRDMSPCLTLTQIQPIQVEEEQCTEAIRGATGLLVERFLFRQH